MLEHSVLENKDREQLVTIAQALGIKSVSRAKKADLIGKILEATGAGTRSAAPATQQPSLDIEMESAPAASADVATPDEAPAASPSDDAPEASADPIVDESRRRSDERRDGRYPGCGRPKPGSVGRTRRAGRSCSGPTVSHSPSGRSPCSVKAEQTVSKPPGPPPMAEMTIPRATAVAAVAAAAATATGKRYWRRGTSRRPAGPDRSGPTRAGSQRAGPSRSVTSRSATQRTDAE